MAKGKTKRTSAKDGDERNPSEAKPSPDMVRPTAIEMWAYLNRFLVWLACGFTLAAVGGFSYNAYTRKQADAALAAIDGDAPSAANILAAFDDIKTPHLFAGWHVPKRIIPDDESALKGVDEEALADAVIGLTSVPGPSKTTLADCGSPTTLTASNTACLMAALAREPTRETRPEERERLLLTNRLFHYLKLRRAMARGEVLDAPDLRWCQWNVTVWVRAFERQLVVKQAGTPTASDVAMIQHLVDNKSGATDNALIVSWYALIGSVLFIGAWLAWRRIRVRYEASEADPFGPIRL